MSLQQQARFPLGDFSQSRMNNLGLFGGNYLSGATTSMTTLPSIKSLINHTPMNDHILPQTQMNSQIRLQHPHLSLRHEPMLVRSQSLPVQPLRNYTDLSQKLKVRLQFAYYKYRTQQGDKKFAELKQRYAHKTMSLSSKSEHHPVVSGARIHRLGQRKSTTKRRKLVVSHGNYRTPSKKHAIQPISKSIDDSIADSTAQTSKSYSSYVDSNASTTTAATTLPHPHNDTTVVGALTTPVRNQQKIALFPKQETPMSVKAAKSLIHLFTSSNQF